VKVGGHARYVSFWMAGVAIPRNLLADIPRINAELRPLPVISTVQTVPCVRRSSKLEGEVCLR